MRIANRLAVNVLKFGGVVSVYSQGRQMAVWYQLVQSPHEKVMTKSDIGEVADISLSDAIRVIETASSTDIQIPSRFMANMIKPDVILNSNQSFVAPLTDVYPIFMMWQEFPALMHNITGAGPLYLRDVISFTFDSDIRISAEEAISVQGDALSIVGCKAPIRLKCISSNLISLQTHLYASKGSVPLDKLNAQVINGLTNMLGKNTIQSLDMTIVNTPGGLIRMAVVFGGGTAADIDEMIGMLRSKLPTAEVFIEPSMTRLSTASDGYVPREPIVNLLGTYTNVTQDDILYQIGRISSNDYWEMSIGAETVDQKYSVDSETFKAALFKAITAWKRIAFNMGNDSPYEIKFSGKNPRQEVEHLCTMLRRLPLGCAPVSFYLV